MGRSLVDPPIASAPADTVQRVGESVSQMRAQERQTSQRYRPESFELP
jgi:hypothetical protein